MSQRTARAAVLSRAGFSPRGTSKTRGDISWEAAKGPPMLETLLHNHLASSQTYFPARNHCMNLTDTYILRDFKICWIFRNASSVYIKEELYFPVWIFTEILWHFENHVTSKYFTMPNIYMLIYIFYFKTLSFYFSFISQFKYCGLYKLLLLTMSMISVG